MIYHIKVFPFLLHGQTAIKESKPAIKLIVVSLQESICGSQLRYGSHSSNIKYKVVNKLIYII